MEQGGLVPQEGGDLLHRKAGSGLVVDQHDADQGGVLPEGTRHLGGGDAAAPVRLEACDLVSLLLQCAKTPRCSWRQRAETSKIKPFITKGPL